LTLFPLLDRIVGALNNVGMKFRIKPSPIFSSVTESSLRQNEKIKFVEDIPESSLEHTGRGGFHKR